MVASGLNQGQENMNSKLLTIGGAALFSLALNFSAAASTYDVSGAFPFSSDTFTGSIDVSGGSVSSADITLGPSESVLTNVSSFEVGPVWTVAVDNSSYLLSFLFTLPSSFNDDTGSIFLATLSEYVTNEVCRTERKKTVCEPETTTQFLKGLGYGTVTAASVITTGGDVATPLPATFPLLATGLGVMGLLGWGMKRKASAIIAAA